MPILHIGPPLQAHLPTNANWNSFKIFDQRRLVWSLGVGISAGICVALIWTNFYPSSLPFGSPSWTEIATAVMILAIGHEAMHLLGFPRAGLDSRSVIGIWTETGSPFVQHLSPMSRNQFLLSAVLPFVALTMLPFILVPSGIGSLAYLSWISVLNSIGAGSDIFIIAKVLSTVPRDASVIESGDLMYWADSSRS